MKAVSLYTMPYFGGRTMAYHTHADKDLKQRSFQLEFTTGYCRLPTSSTTRIARVIHGLGKQQHLCNGTVFEYVPE